MFTFGNMIVCLTEYFYAVYCVSKVVTINFLIRGWKCVVTTTLKYHFSQAKFIRNLRCCPTYLGRNRGGGRLK